MSIEQRVSALEVDVTESEGRVFEAIADLRVSQQLLAEGLAFLLDPRDIAYTPARQDLTKRIRSHFKMPED